MELCHKYDANGECRFGSVCIFAHGKEELYTPIEDSDYYRAPPAPSLDFSVVDFANSGKQVPVARTAKAPSSPEKDRRRKTTGSSAGNGSKGGNGGGRGKSASGGDGQRRDSTTVRSAPQAAAPAQQARPESMPVLLPPAPIKPSPVIKSSPVLPAPARPPTPDTVDPALDGAQMVFNGPLELRSSDVSPRSQPLRIFLTILCRPLQRPSATMPSVHRIVPLVPKSADLRTSQRHWSSTTLSASSGVRLLQSIEPLPID